MENKIFPNYKEVYVGQKVEFSCNSDCPEDSNECATIWTFDNGLLYGKPYYLGKKLSIESAQMDDDGVYSCYGLEVGHLVHHRFESHATLTVYREFLCSFQIIIKYTNCCFMAFYLSFCCCYTVSRQI